MADYSLLLAEIDKYRNMAKLVDQQRMMIEDDIHTMLEKIKRVEEDARKEKEELYIRLESTPIVHGPQAKHGWPPTAGRDGSSSSMLQSNSHRIKDSIRTLPGFTEFVKNSELLEAFRQSYARDIQDYCRQNTSNLNRDFNMSATPSDGLELSEGKEKLNNLYNSFKNQKAIKQSEIKKLPHHNNTIKEDIREYEEEFATNGPYEKIGNNSKTSQESPIPAQPTRNDVASKSTKKTVSQDKHQHPPDKKDKSKSSLNELRPDLKDSFPSEVKEGLLQIPSDAHIHRYPRATGNSDLMSPETETFNPVKQRIPSASGNGQTSKSNKWLNEKDTIKANTTNKTTSLKEEDYATNFGNNVSESEDKSGFVVTPQKAPPQRNTVTSDQSQPIKTTSKKEDVLTFRKRDSASKIRFTNENETVDLGNNKDSYFDNEYSAAGVHRSNAKTNTFQEVSHRHYGDQSDVDYYQPQHAPHYIHEENHEGSDAQEYLEPYQPQSEREHADNIEGTSLDYSHTRRFTTDENFNGTGNNQGKRFRISQSSNDKFKLRSSKETNKQDSNFQKKDDNSLTMNYGTNLTAMPSANHFDGNNTFERDRTLNIMPVASSEIQKNYGFGADDISLIKKSSQKSGSGTSPTNITALLRGDTTLSGKQASGNQADVSPVNIPPHLQNVIQREDVFAARNKEMINRFDTFFKKMAIEDKEKWDDSEVDDTRMQFMKDSNIGYDEYLEAIGHKKTTNVMDTVEKTVPHKQAQMAKPNEKADSRVHQSKSISYLSDMPSRLNYDGPSIGLRIETGGGALIRDTINTIKPRETEFDSARVTTERLVSLVKSEITTEGHAVSELKTSKKKDRIESNISGSVYPKTIHESNMKSRHTYASSKNYHYQMNDPIDDEPEDEFEDEWRPENSKEMFQDEIEEDFEETVQAPNRNRFSNDNQSVSQPSEEIDEVFIDEKLIYPASTLRPTGPSSRLPSGKSNVLDSQLEDEEISLSMGTKNPGQIFKNKLSQREANNRYG